MKAIVKLDEVSYEYGSHSLERPSVKALSGISEEIREGEFIVMLGRNGSGKSTMARLLNALLLPTFGSVIIDGMETSDSDMVWNIRKTLGMIFQNPDNQIVATTVEEDIAFGPENLGIEPDEIKKRVVSSAATVGMEGMLKNSPHMLSGGQKQRVAIAGILAMEPRCIVLDEATSMLDPRGRKEVIELLHKLNREKKITVILITHHMDEAVHADRILVMQDGKVVLKGIPQEIFSQVNVLRDAGLDVPPVADLMHRLKMRGIEIGDIPVTIGQTIDALKSILKDTGISKRESDMNDKFEGDSESIISVEGLTHVYMPGTAYEKKALDNVSLEVKKGEILGIIGHTGSGKSTLVQHLNGILKPSSGSILVDGLKAEGKTLKELRQRVGLIFQYPEHQLFEETVYKDISFGLTKMMLPAEETERRVRHAINILGLSDEILEKSPFELSGGQKRRVAIAGVLVMEPSVLILDEPTAGLDPKGSQEVFQILTRLNSESGTTIIIISHNMDDIAAYCSRVAVMNKGILEMIATPEKIFSKVERLKELDLDIPMITQLFQSLKDEGIYFKDIILNIGDGEKAIMNNLSCGGVRL